jgi:hypothetical protein
MEKAELIDELFEKIKLLSAAALEHRIDLGQVKPWLAQFAEATVLEDDEQLHALFMLTHFIFFGQAEIRELLRSLFRDLFKAPVVYALRRSNSDTRDHNFIEAEFQKVLKRTRFLGVGNPSESGVHILYYFRQENELPKNLFINSHEIFRREPNDGGGRIVVRDQEIEHYIFIDDLCGSGTQAKDYSVDLVVPLKRQKPGVKVSYFVLFATSEGLKAVRNLRCFYRVGAVFELDDTFKSLEPQSRIFSPEESPFLREHIKATCQKYGCKLWPSGVPISVQWSIRWRLTMYRRTPDDSRTARDGRRGRSGRSAQLCSEVARPMRFELMTIDS